MEKAINEQTDIEAQHVVCYRMDGPSGYQLPSSLSRIGNNFGDVRKGVLFNRHTLRSTIASQGLNL